MSSREIAKELGVCQRTILNKMEKFNIKKRSICKALTGKHLSKETKEKLSKSHLSKNLYKLTKEVLYQMYVVENKSIRTISKELGIGRNIISNYLKQYGIENRYNKNIKVDKDKLYKFYIVEGKTASEIGKLFNTSHKTITRRLIKYHIPIRKFKYGNITRNPENKLARNRTKYRNWRKKCIVRDDFTCQACGKMGGKLNVHHINNFSEFKELRYKVDNGITLCEECHRQFHCLYGKKNNTRGQIDEFIKH
jgi:transposase